MLTVYPDYYTEFQCIAGKCRHSCCEHWEIDVDDDALERFEGLPQKQAQSIMQHIDMEDSPHFILDEQERCPFLNEQNLCNLILEHGEGMLCQICADHPRYRNFMTDRTEIGIGLCCEEAARIILSRKEPVHLIEVGQESARTESENHMLVQREELIRIAQDRNLSVWEREERILASVNRGGEAWSFEKWLEIFMDLEHMEEDWVNLLNDCREFCGQGETEWNDAEKTESEIPFEQLLVYFLYRHCPAALDDCDCVSKALFAVLSSRMIRSIENILKKRKNDYSAEDRIELVRLYSAEIEYSEDNTNCLFDTLFFG